MRQLISRFAMMLCLAYPVAAGAHDMAGMDMSTMHAPATETAPATTGPAPTVVVATRTEEGKRMLGATVTLNGKPLVGAKVKFLVQRSFGALDIGHDETFDDGVAAVKFPEGLPGGTAGKLHIIAKVTGTSSYAAASGDSIVDSDTVVVPDADPFPRAIWAPHAPIPLILTLVLALGGVWTTYMFVLGQLRLLRRADNP